MTVRFKTTKHDDELLLSEVDVYCLDYFVRTFTRVSSPPPPPPPHLSLFLCVSVSVYVCLCLYVCLSVCLSVSYSMSRTSLLSQ